MKILFSDINKGGLSEDIILHYQSLDKTKRYVSDIKRGDSFPPIKLYSNTNVIADGIHRICAYLACGIYVFDFKYY